MRQRPAAVQQSRVSGQPASSGRLPALGRAGRPVLPGVLPSALLPVLLPILLTGLLVLSGCAPAPQPQPPQPPRPPVAALVQPEPQDLRGIPQNVTALLAQQPGRANGKASLDALLLTPQAQARFLERFRAAHFGPWAQTNATFGPASALWGLGTLSANNHYGENLRPLGPGFKAEMEALCQASAYPSPVRPAIATANTSLRVLPTIRPGFLKPSRPGEGFPFDYWQNSGVWAGTPLVVTHLSADGAWALVEARNAGGWVRLSDIAFVDQEFMARWMALPLLAVTRDRMPLSTLDLGRGGQLTPGLATGQSTSPANSQGVPVNGQGTPANSQGGVPANGQEMGSANGQGSGPANGQEMGPANGQGMGQASGQDAGQGGGQNIGQIGGQNIGQIGGQNVGQTGAGGGIFLFQGRIGMVLPLAGQDTSGYTALAPARKADGQAEIVSVRIKASDAAAMPLAATPRNLGRLADQMLGQPYGWGGYYENRDCSALMLDLMTPLGLFLPRNSSQQARSGEYVSFEGLTAPQKEALLLARGVPLLTLLYKRGHIMLYLGQQQGRALMLHNIWGLKSLDESGTEGRVVIGRAVVTTLEPGRELPEVARAGTLLEGMAGMTLLAPGGLPPARPDRTR